MLMKDAFELTIELARQNVLEEKYCSGSRALEIGRQHQLEAIDKVQQFIDAHNIIIGQHDQK